MMEYAYLFSGMGVTIIYLGWKVFTLTNSRNYYRHVITGIAKGDYKIKIRELDNCIETEIMEVRK